MKVAFTDEALRNLDEILGYTATHYPTVYDALVVRLQSVIARIAEWPDSAGSDWAPGHSRRAAHPISLQGLLSKDG